MAKIPVVGKELRNICNKMKRLVDERTANCKPASLTGMQGWIMGYIAANEGRDIFQKDVEKEFDIRRSTASGILQLMETNGYLIRQPVLRDGRLKKLVLTAKAMEIHDRISEQILRTENQLVWDFTEEEKAELMRLLRKMSDNLDRNSF